MSAEEKSAEQQLLDLYDRVGDAPDAIPRLRSFVLDLAIRGKLVEQDPNDEPGSILLERIAAEKTRLWEAGEIRRPKAAQPLKTSEIPFIIPEGWAWGQIANLGITSPRNEAADNQQASFVRMPMVAAEYGVANGHEERPWREIKKGYTHLAEGDVGLAKITPCFENGKSTVFRNLTGGFGAGTTELHLVRPFFVDSDYILLFLKSAHFIEAGIPNMTGTAGQRRVPTEYFTSSPFPLPPLIEQHRIVAKVDELMALLDRLEATQTAAESTRDRLTVASLNRLTAPDTTLETFPDHARFALDALPSITTRADQIQSLRQTILNLAVRGKLVAQDESETVAEQFGGRGGLDWMPSNWRAISFGGHCDIQGGNQPPKSQFIREPRPGYVRLFQIQDLGSRPSPVYIPKTSTNRFCQEGEILIGRYGASVGKIFWAQDGAYNVAMAKFVWPKNALNKEFAFLLLKSEIFQDAISGASRSAQAGFNKRDLQGIKLPTPPVAEQKRIGERVTEIITLCESLESALDEEDNKKQQILKNLLHKTLAGQKRYTDAT